MTHKEAQKIFETITRGFAETRYNIQKKAGTEEEKFALYATWFDCVEKTFRGLKMIDPTIDANEFRIACFRTVYHIDVDEYSELRLTD
jgi:hypothetical protein